jgi:octaprenyl-diphosphate synthase
LALAADDMRQVDAIISRRLDSGVPLVGQVAGYIVSSGGKRLRPVLLLLMCQALGCPHPQRHNLAAVVEFIHTATLLHDDVVDESTCAAAAPPPMRRSATRPACWSAISSIRAPSR